MPPVDYLVQAVSVSSKSIMEGMRILFNPMFGLREENGREEKKNKGDGKNMGPSYRFFNKFSSFSLLSCYPDSGKSLISLHFPPLPLKPNIV